MTPQDQQVFGATGDCFRACVASLLDVPLNAVPNFFDLGPARRWNHHVCEWLAERGLHRCVLDWHNSWRDVEQPLIVSGETSRANGLHAVIWQRGSLLHDPHPSRLGIIEPRQIDLLFVVDGNAFYSWLCLAKET